VLARALVFGAHIPQERGGAHSQVVVCGWEEGCGGKGMGCGGGMREDDNINVDVGFKLRSSPR